MLNICACMPGVVCGPVGSGTSHGNQTIVRPGILLLKKQATVHPGASLYGIKKRERHLNRNLKNPLLSSSTLPEVNMARSGAVVAFRLYRLMVMSMKSGTG